MMKNRPLWFLRKLTALTTIAILGLAAQFFLASTLVHANDAATNYPISQSEIIARAQYWVYKGYTYSQTQYEPDPLGTTYRTDCSGLVSMAWHLDQSYTTYNFNTDSSLWYTISLDSMVQGDAFVRHDSTEQHMELFDRWKSDSDHSQGFYVYSFNSDGYTVENPIMLNNVGKSGYRSYSYLDGFHAIRYKNKFHDNTAATESTTEPVGSTCPSTYDTYSLTGSTVTIKERTCYSTSYTYGSGYSFKAIEEIQWTGGGPGQLDGFTAHVDIQQSDKNKEESYCSGMAAEINASSSGTRYCYVSLGSITAGTWTADGWIHFDVNNDGKIWSMKYVGGSASITF